nr:reverse transcriptase domain-containing protein [Tanacetum cinerariifolium]
MLDRTDFASWQQRIRLYCRGKHNGVNILKSIDEGPYILGTFRETLAESTEGTPQFGPERPRVYSDLNSNERDRYNADIRATNILLQGFPKDIYILINHYIDAKDIWDNVKMLLEGSQLTKEDKESQLYDDFEHFRQHKEESINDYYVRFSKLINDIRNIKMTMPKLHLNSKFVNNMLLEWGRFVTAVKLNRGLRESNYDQLFAYLKQHEAHAKENKMVLERLSQPIAQPTADPLALLSNVSNTQHGLPSLSTSSITPAEDCDAFDSDVDEAPTAQTMFMANVSSVDPITDEAVPSYDSDILSELNSKFVNNMLPEWARFVTAVKLNKGLRESNYDQLFAYLKQHEAHAKENKMVLERLSQPIAQPTVDPLALLSNVSNTQHGLPSSSTSSITPVTPPRANSTDDLIENLTSTLALLTQSYRTFLPQTNNQLRTSSNPRNQATVQDGRVVVQNVQGRPNRGQGMNPWGGNPAGYGEALNRVGNVNQGQARPGQARTVKCYNCNGTGHIARNCTQPKRPQNSEYFKDKMLLMHAQENGAKNCDAFDSNVDEAPTAQTMFMANLSSADPITDEAGPSYDSDILSEPIKENKRCQLGAGCFSRLWTDQPEGGRKLREGSRSTVQENRPPRMGYGGEHLRTENYNRRDHYQPYVSLRAHDQGYDNQRTTRKENLDKYCDYHGIKGYHTNDCYQLKSIGRQQGNNNTNGKIINMIQVRGEDLKRKYQRNQEEDWMKMAITFPLIPADDLLDEPLIIEAELEGYLVRRVFVDHGVA